jgi:hypothetical protein
MRKLLFAFGGLILPAILFVTVSIACIVYIGTVLDAQSKAFVDDTVPALATSWQKEQLLSRTAPEFRSEARQGELTLLFQSLSRFGKLFEYQGAIGNAYLSYASATISAAYTAKAKFQNGDALFEIWLLKRNGRWMIYDFHVDVPKGSANRSSDKQVLRS